MSIKKRLTEWKKESPIRKYRTQQGLSQADLASILGVAAYTLQRWEEGAMNPGEKNISKLKEVIPEFEKKWREWKSDKPTM
ncbi:helix-turn-helix domain-containing protein [Niallia circulans]|uniref:helix-turn-helix domain-containing protein n=1 Tax=Niallia circulans TaxID=1397 RepID=UPI0026EC2A31|nr:helix-turn-helix transcriptional regulator [Niallia circulans]